jgi:uracil-DNA glycosylase
MRKVVTKLDRLAAEIRACRLCAVTLPLGPNPIVRLSTSARVCIIGQAPGTKVHYSGIPWNDRSGDRLREWLGLDRENFYDVSKIAIMPMGFCYPGRDSHGGDLPPRPECAPAWHGRVLALMPQVELTLLVGSHAQKRYLETNHRRTMTETVAAWRDHLPQFLPLPHPSWRNTAWLKANPWFTTDLVPKLRRRIHTLVG